MILITIAVHVARVEVLGLGRVALLDWLSTVGAAVGRSLGCLLLVSWSLAIRLLWLTIGSSGLSVRWLLWLLVVRKLLRLLNIAGLLRLLVGRLRV